MKNYQQKSLYRILEKHLLNGYFPEKNYTKNWYEDFKKAIPESKYETYSDAIDFDYQFGKSKISIIPTSFFASTSGLNTRLKLIPHSNRTIKNYLHSSYSLFFNLLKQQGLFNTLGKNLLITGKPVDFISPHNIPVGSISGKIASEMYKIAPFLFTYSPNQTSNLNPIDRYKYIIESFRPEQITGIVGTNPFIIHKFLSDKISPKGISNNELIYKDLEKAYPKVKYIICLNGHPLKWHSEQLKRAFNGSVNIYDPGIGASEGIYTSGGFSFDSVGFPIHRNASQFIEYKPINSNSQFANFDIREFVGEFVEPLITTDYGFRRYLIEDTYEVIKYNNKIALKFISKKDKVYSHSSERVYDSNIYELMKKYSELTKINITDFIFYYEKVNGDLGRYTFVISTNDFRIKKIEAEIFKSLEIFDKIFQDINPEYRNSRNNNFLLPASLRLDNEFIPKFRTEKFEFKRQEKEQMFIKL